MKRDSGEGIFWYHRDVSGLRIARAFVALLCVALLLCLAISPSGPQLDPAIPVLVLCFLAVLTPSRLRVSVVISLVQPISLFSVSISRAPPLA